MQGNPGKSSSQMNKRKSNTISNMPSGLRKSKTIDFSGRINTRRFTDFSNKTKDQSSPLSLNESPKTKSNQKSKLRISFLDSPNGLNTSPTESIIQARKISKSAPSIQEIKRVLSPYLEGVWVHYAARLKYMRKVQRMQSSNYWETWKVFDSEEKDFYTLKEIHRKNYETQREYEIAVYKEIQPLLSIYDESDKSLLGVYLINLSKDMKTCFLLTELSKGTLQEYIEYRELYRVDWKEPELEFVLWHVLDQIFKLKKLNIYHKDIRPGTIIISGKENQIKLADFTSSVSISPEEAEKAKNSENKARLKEYEPLMMDLFSAGFTVLQIVENSLRKEDWSEYLNDTFKDFYPTLFEPVKGLVDRKLVGKREQMVEEMLTEEPNYSKWSKIEKRDPEIDFKYFKFQNLLKRLDSNLQPSFYFEMYEVKDAISTLEREIENGAFKRKEGVKFKALEWEATLLKGYMLDKQYKQAFKQAQKILNQQEELQEAIEIKANVFAQVGQIMSEFGKHRSAINYLGNSLKLKKQKFGESSQQVALVYYQIAEACEKDKKYIEAINAIAKSLEVCQKISGKPQVQLVIDNYRLLGNIWAQEGKYQESLDIYTKAKDFCIKTYGGEIHPNVAEQFVNIGKMNLKFAKRDEAAKSFEKSVSIKKKYSGENSFQLAKLFGEIGMAYEESLILEEAENYLVKSLEIYKEDEREDIFNKAGAYLSLSNLLCKKGRYNEALENLLESLSLKEGYVIDEETQMVQLAFDYSLCVQLYSILKQPENARIYLHKMKEVGLEVFEPSQDIITCYLKIGSVLFEMQEFENSFKYLNKALLLCQQNFSGEWRMQSRCLEKLGLINIANGKYEEGLSEFNRALSLQSEKALDWQTALIYCYIGKAYQYLSDYEKAEESYEKGLEMLRTKYPENNYLVGSQLVELSGLFKLKGDLEKAVEKCHEALNILKVNFEKSDLRIVKCEQEIKDLEERLSENDLPP